MKIILTIIIALITQSVFACNKSIYTTNDAYVKADYVFSGQISNLRYLDDKNKTKLEPRIIVTTIFNFSFGA